MYTQLQQRGMDQPPVNVSTLRRMKAEKEPIACITAYDASFAALVDQAGADLVLVGDSLGMVVQGHDSTLPVTVADVAYHTACVARGAARPWIVADMPFGSFQASPGQAYANAVTLMQAGSQMVKVEGGAEMAPTVEFLVGRGIPVCAHIGLTPQHVNVFGGYRVQGRGEDAARIRRDAEAVVRAGAFSVVLEKVPDALAREITQAIDIPAIGIGASADCDGQVLVVDDMLGLFTAFRPKFVKRYAELGEEADRAIAAYAAEVRARTFPAPEYVFGDKAAGK